MKPSTIDEHSIREAEKHLLDAMIRSDIAVLEQLLHDDLLFVLPTGEVITKQMDLETHKSGNLVLKEITSTLDSVQQIGENATVTLSSKITGSMSGQDFEGSFRYLRVWKRFEGQFKVIAGSCVAM